VLQPLRLATRSPNKLIKLCIGVAFVTPNRLPTGMPYRHPSTPKHNQGPKLERHWIRQSLSSAVSYIQDAADACSAATSPASVISGYARWWPTGSPTLLS
jgi:hypothetical protein